MCVLCIWMASKWNMSHALILRLFQMFSYVVNKHIYKVECFLNIAATYFEKL